LYGECPGCRQFVISQHFTDCWPSFSVSSAIEPVSTQPIPDSVPEDVKRLLKKFPSILRRVIWCPPRVFSEFRMFFLIPYIPYSIRNCPKFCGIPYYGILRILWLLVSRNSA
jgi:hypothetical protein